MSAELFAQFPFQHLARSIARQIGREDDPLGCLVGARHLPMRWVRARSSSARTLKSDFRGAISCGVVPGYQFTLLRWALRGSSACLRRRFGLVPNRAHGEGWGRFCLLVWGVGSVLGE